MLKSFEFQLNTRFIFGKGAHEQVGEELESNQIQSILIHHDGGEFLYQSGLLSGIIEDCKKHGISCHELGGVQPNPRLKLVYEGIELVKKHEIEMVLAVGGGSVIDSSKAIAAGAVCEGDVWDFYTGEKNIEGALPVGVILTYPATGSESSNVSVINHADIYSKLLVSSSFLQPRIAFMNPELTYTLPRKLTAYGIVDMFSHICERYFSPDQPIGAVDRMATGMLKTLVEIGPKVLQEPDSYEYRSELMWIGAMAHNDIVGVGREQDWTTHIIGNELSALYDTPHGVTLSVLMGSWMRYVYLNDLERFAAYANEVFAIPYQSELASMAVEGIEKTEEFFAQLSMPISLSSLGIKNDEIDDIVNQISFANEGETIGGFVKLDKEDVYTICRNAWKDK